MAYELLPNGTFRCAVLSPYSGLTPLCRLLLLALAEYCHPRLATVFPTQQQLANDTGISTRTIRVLMREAIQGGWVIRCENRDHFRLMIPDAPSVPELPTSTNLTVVGEAPSAEPKAVTDARRDLERRKAARRAADAKKFREGADIVLTYYRDSMGKNGNFIVDDVRRNLVVRALRENGGNVSELLYVVDGCRRSDFHMGRERDGKVKDRLDLLYRNRETIEQFTALSGWDGTRLHPYVQMSDG